jgi:hypothetical protein
MIVYESGKVLFAPDVDDNAAMLLIFLICQMLHFRFLAAAAGPGLPG